jgi:hypothetical protein
MMAPKRMAVRLIQEQQSWSVKRPSPRAFSSFNSIVLPPRVCAMRIAERI